MGKDLLYVQEMGSVLEKSVMKFFRNEKAVVQFEKWYLAVSFCNIHALPLPSSLLKYLAQNREWFSFVMCMDIFKYPYEQVCIKWVIRKRSGMRVV